ncbi:hypothetical protein [Atlantibacter sp.]|uniref:hypothetical protein n=1 Tax=Atlantibacter sp. TaxID=1903473 RepID=UPI00289B098B|nr:hypothetical protein [Atlantibacter sp.]
MTKKGGALAPPFLLPTENHDLWAWSSTGFGSASLPLDLYITGLAETAFKGFCDALTMRNQSRFCEGGFLFLTDNHIPWARSSTRFGAAYRVEI